MAVRASGAVATGGIGTGAKHAGEHAAWQESLDQKWRALNANASDTVFAVLAHAFADNKAAGTIGSTGRS